MKNVPKSLLLILLLMLIAENSSAQSGWFPLSGGPISKEFTSIEFVNADTGFVGTADGHAFRTTDAGISWNPLDVYASTLKYEGGRLIAKAEWIYISTDLGATWINDNNMLHRDASFPTPAIGFSIDRNSHDYHDVNFAKSVDSGKTWLTSEILQTPLDGERVSDIKWLEFRDSLHGVVTEQIYNTVTNEYSELPYGTSDGGITWNLLHVTADAVNVAGGVWVTSGPYGNLYRTTDDFMTTSSVQQNVIRPPGSTCVPKDHLCVVNGSIVSAISAVDGSIFRSTDSGTTWYQQRCGNGMTGLGWEFGAISTPTPLVGYAVGLDSQIYKTIDGGGPPLTSSVLNPKPCDCNTSLVPNPSQGYLDLSFDAVETRTSIEVFDALGRRMIIANVAPGATGFKLSTGSLAIGSYSILIGTKVLRFVKE